MEMMTGDHAQEMESMEKLKRFIRLNTGNLATVLVCVVFFCSAFLVPGKNEDINLIEIFLNSFMAFCASTSVNSLYNNRAIVNGLLDPDVVKAAASHNERIDAITEHSAIDELNTWCQDVNRKNYRNQRTRVLSMAGLSYETCFTEAGEVKKVEIQMPEWREIRKLGYRMWRIRRATARRQTRAYKRAVYLKLSEVSAGELTGEGGNRNDPYNLGRGIAEYKKQIALRKTVSKIVTAIVFGYMAVGLINDFSWVSLFIRAIQIALFLVFGSVQYLSTMDYLTNEYKNRLTLKARLLLSFMSEKRPDIIEAMATAEGGAK